MEWYGVKTANLFTAGTVDAMHHGAVLFVSNDFSILEWSCFTGESTSKEMNTNGYEMKLIYDLNRGQSMYPLTCITVACAVSNFCIMSSSWTLSCSDFDNPSLTTSPNVADSLLFNSYSDSPIPTSPSDWDWLNLRRL